MNLLVEFFRSHDLRRDTEYVYTLHENLGNASIRKVFLFVEPETSIHFESSKLELVVSNQRPTFKDFFEFCNDRLEGETCLVANGDIVFDDSIKGLDEQKLKGVFLALSRWEVDEAGKRKELNRNAASQDSWIFQSPVRVSESMKFHLGTPGCDNRIAMLMDRLGYQVSNPAMSLVTQHLHHSEVRTYSPANRIPGPYLLVPPSELGQLVDGIYVEGFDESGAPIVCRRE